MHIKSKIITVAAVAAAVLGGGAYSLAATGAGSAGGLTYRGCENASTRTPFDVYSTKTPTCPKGSWAVSWNQTGPQGPSGVVSVSTTDLGGVASVPTGGSFVTNATQVGTVSLAAGTYLVTLNAKVTPPSGGTGAVSVFPNLFLYDQAANPDFTGDLLNICSGALESGTNYQIDSYCSGSAVVTVPAGGQTLYVYAFGYDSDRGSGSYVLDDAASRPSRSSPAASTRCSVPGLAHPGRAPAGDANLGRTAQTDRKAEQRRWPACRDHGRPLRPA
jgi:hypothetical protein